MANTGLLIVTKLSKIVSSLSAAKTHVQKTLYIQLQPHTKNTTPSPIYNSVVAKIYALSVVDCKHLDVRVILSNLKNNHTTKLRKTVDVLIFDDVNHETKTFTEKYSISNVIKLENSDNSQEIDEPSEEGDFQVYDNVVLGGTFDRLHIGHKILLSEAVLRAKLRLVVGVTDTNMIQSKKLPELILPVSERIKEVEDFLTDIDDSLKYEIVPIQDPFGPTKSDPDMQAIVVSAETYKGGLKVNELRVQNKLNELNIHCIKLVELESDCTDKEYKVSSSNQRMDLLGGQIREPSPRRDLPKKPYIIGLTGGIASGKSVMSERFRKLGAAIIDCDKLAHQIYEPGTECFEQIKNNFGSDVIDSNGKIDRKVLGGIVFGNPEKMNLLNSLVWPALLKTTKNHIQKLADNKDAKIIFMEAAILLRAGWQKECHEVWSCIIPEEEVSLCEFLKIFSLILYFQAIKRVMERNSLTEVEAKARINSQIDNETIVKNSHVVFSSLWSYAYSQLQAEKAFSNLLETLRKDGNNIKGVL